MQISKIFSHYPVRTPYPRPGMSMREREIWEKVMKSEARRKEILFPQESSSTIVNIWAKIRKFIYEYITVF